MDMAVVFEWFGQIRAAEQAHEPIVDPLLWKAAQPQKGKPRKKASDGALLSGVLRCASCKRRLSPSERFYRCRPRMVSGPECDAPANVSAAEAEALVTRAFFDWLAYRPLAPAPPDLAPLEQAVALAKADEAKWKEAAVAGTVAPEVVGPAYDAAKARREQAEKGLFEARQTAGLDDERLTLAERWGTMSVPERRRALTAFETGVVLAVLLMLVGSVTFAVAVAAGLATGADVF
jgi:hypothetical protein